MKYQEEDKTSQANTSADSHSGSLIISTESLFSLSQYDDVNTNINSFTFIGHEDCSSIDRNTTKSNKLGSAFNCPALNQLSSNGSINITSREGKTFISKIQQVYIEDNYKKLFEKGKHKLGDYSLYDSTLPDIHFWYRRYYYYTKFQEGIQMDYESWYSVTPEPIAKYIANLVKGKTIIDGFCGSGGNVIQFSKKCKKVYAIDIDKTKLLLCKNNCGVYKCKSNIDFIQSDYLQLKNKLPLVDFVFLSPPWGGIEYKFKYSYDIHKLMIPNVYDIIRVSLSLSKNIIFYLPRNLILDDLYFIISDIKNEIENGSGNQLCFDVRIIKSNHTIKALLVIFGYEVNDIINQSDMNDYLVGNYDYVNYDNINLVWMISRIIGLYTFFVNEIEFKANRRLVNSYDYNNINQLIRLFMGSVLTEENKQILEKSYFSYGKRRCEGFSHHYYFKDNNKLKLTKELSM